MASLCSHPGRLAGTSTRDARMTPVFAVVGHPNKGKSSIVSTIAQKDNIAISPRSGTTQDTQHIRHFYRRGRLCPGGYTGISTPVPSAGLVAGTCSIGGQAPRRGPAIHCRSAMPATVPGRSHVAQADHGRVRPYFMSWMAHALTAPNTKPRWKYCAGRARPAWH